jgi:hypothetical protein
MPLALSVRQSGMRLTVLAPHCVHTKRRRRTMDGNCTSSARSSAAKVNGTECWQAAFAQVTKRPSRPWPLRCAMVGGASGSAKCSFILARICVPYCIPNHGICGIQSNILMSSHPCDEKCRSLNSRSGCRYANRSILWRIFIVVHGQPKLVLGDEVERGFHVSQTKFVRIVWSVAMFIQGRRAHLRIRGRPGC